MALARGRAPTTTLPGAAADPFQPDEDEPDTATEAVCVTLLWVDADTRVAHHWDPMEGVFRYADRDDGRVHETTRPALVTGPLFADVWYDLRLTSSRYFFGRDFSVVFPELWSDHKRGPYASVVVVLVFVLCHALCAADPGQVVLALERWASDLQRDRPFAMRVLLLWWLDRCARARLPWDLLAAAGWRREPPDGGRGDGARGCIAWTEGDGPCGAPTAPGWALCASHRRRLVVPDDRLAAGPDAPFAGHVVPPLDGAYELWRRATTAPEALGLRPTARDPNVDPQTEEEHVRHCSDFLGGLKESVWERCVGDVSQRMRLPFNDADLYNSDLNVRLENGCTVDPFLGLTERGIRKAIEAGERVLWLDVNWT